MPRIDDIELKTITDNFVVALNDWAYWKDDPTAHAAERRGTVAGAFFHAEGLAAPSEPVTAAEAAALREMVAHFETIRDSAPRMNRRLGISDAGIVTLLHTPSVEPGWRYLSRAFGVGVIAPSVAELRAYRQTPVEAASRADIAERIYDAVTEEMGSESDGGVYESPEDAFVSAAEADGASYAEYAAAESALVFAESGGGVFDPAAGGEPGGPGAIEEPGGEPEGAEPAGVEHGEGGRGR